MMKNRFNFFLLFASALVALVLGAAIGSSEIPVGNLMSVMANKLFEVPLPEDISPVAVSILWSIRLPRAVMAFLVLLEWVN